MSVNVTELLPARLVASGIQLFAVRSVDRATTYLNPAFAVKLNWKLALDGDAGALSRMGVGLTTLMETELVAVRPVLFAAMAESV